MRPPIAGKKYVNLIIITLMMTLRYWGTIVSFVQDFWPKRNHRGVRLVALTTSNANKTTTGYITGTYYNLYTWLVSFRWKPISDFTIITAKAINKIMKMFFWSPATIKRIGKNPLKRITDRNEPFNNTVKNKIDEITPVLDKWTNVVFVHL